MAADSGSTHLCSSFLTLVARLTHNLNRNFVRADDARNGSEETVTAFTVSQTSHNSRTTLQFANPRIKIQENVCS